MSKITKPRNTGIKFFIALSTLTYVAFFHIFLFYTIYQMNSDIWFKVSLSSTCLLWEFTAFCVLRNQQFQRQLKTSDLNKNQKERLFVVGNRYKRNGITFLIINFIMLNTVILCNSLIIPNYLIFSHYNIVSFWGLLKPDDVLTMFKTLNWLFQNATILTCWSFISCIIIYLCCYQRFEEYVKYLVRLRRLKALSGQYSLASIGDETHDI